MAKGDDIVFKVTTSAKLHFNSIFLTEVGAEHIRSGHRDVALALHSVVKSTVENPTHVYSDKIDFNRYIFVSENITQGMSPMIVIVERLGDDGKIITATPKRGKRTGILWDSDANLVTSIDRESDIFYISRGDIVPSYAIDDEDDPCIWRRYAEATDTPVGLTIFKASKNFAERSAAIIKLISDFIGINESQIETRVNGLKIT